MKEAKKHKKKKLAISLGGPLTSLDEIRISQTIIP
jgi:hypothetical protein